MEDKKYYLGGVIVKFDPTETVYHWKNQGNHNIIPVELPWKDATANSKQYWGEGSVTVRNKFIEVTVHPDGTVETKIHDQIEQDIEKTYVRQTVSDYINEN